MGISFYYLQHAFITIMELLLITIALSLLFFKQFLFICILTYILTGISFYLICIPNSTMIPKVLKNKSNIPKVIFTYWHDVDNIPNSVKICIDSWKRYLPKYKIHIINRNTIKDYLEEDILNLRHSTQNQRISDFLRLALLNKYGGIWMDASILLYRNLDWLHGFQVQEKCEFIGYVLDTPVPNIESWFLACVPGSIFIKDWKEMLFKSNEYKELKDYTKFVSKTTDLSNLPDTEYLTVYVASQYLLQKKNNYKLHLCNLPPFSSLYVFCPFLYKFGKQSLLKFTQHDRSILEKTGLYKWL